MSDPHRLMRVEGQSPLLLASLDDRQMAEAVMVWREAGLTVRCVRGRKMSRFAGLMDEFSAALQFPYYFGENWSAFQECLGDMDWLPPGAGLVIVVTGASSVLTDDSPAELRTLVHTLVGAAAKYAEPVADGEWWDRSAIPFHVVLQASGMDRALASWRAAGAELTLL